MNLTRRLFTKNAPIAVGAAGTLLGDIKQENAIPQRQLPSGVSSLVRGAEVTQTINPPGLVDYWNARDELNRVQYYKNLLAQSHRDVQHNGIPPTIDCLKSVSRVHKHHMMVQRVIKQQEEERTLAEMLMDKFGVRDWFKKNSDGPAQEMGYSESNFL